MASMDGSALLLLLLMLFSAALMAEAAAASTADNTTTFYRRADCPTSCGSINVPYPFGTAPGCAKPGFSLLCDEEADPPKLFLLNSSIEVLNVSLDPVMDIGIGIATMRADADSFNLFWAPPAGAPYVLSTASGASNLSLTVVGCSAVAVLLDHDSNETIASCVTVCAARDIMDAMEGAACSGVGCCQATFSSSVRAYSIRLSRINRPGERWEPASNIKAFVSDDQEAYTFSKEDLFAVDTVRNSKTAAAILRWAITGALSCTDADKNRTSFACLSNNSVCGDAITSGFGYYCVCSMGYEGNPYIPGGCQASMTATPEVVSISDHPKADCPTSCGNITVPFPFGLAPGCYRDEGYHMECMSGESLRFRDIAMDLFYVSEILLEEGQVRVSKAEETLKKQGINPSSGPYTFAAEWVMFNWMIGDSSCREAKTAAYACVSRNSECLNTPAAVNRSGYRCRCAAGYEGNPYVSDGCQDIDECANPDKHICSGICINYDGGYSCCPPGSQINSRHECIPKRVQSQTIMIGVAVGVSSGCSLLLVLISAVLLNRRLKEMKLKRMKERYFHQNHGFLLQKLISADAVSAQSTKIFSLEELEKATNNFDATRILGHGGHGTVYKGILSDQRVVAIKKSKIAVERETNQFINEVAILSQINHRNVVKLHGCCLETEVPLLVYEYVTNGTLADHLHSGSSLSWDDRLRVASEIVGALAYLHSAASISIFHRDVKSSNVLLDDTFTAKVSDFGASRYLPVHQTHITTGIQGTYGYLDPEYYHTGHLTDKSDVYSFGVILVELLTGMKPVSSTKFGEMNLAMYFNWAATRVDCAVEILEARVKAEGKEEEIEKVVALAKECLRLRGAERPPMKDVEIRLLELTRRKKGKKQQHCCADHCGEEKEVEEQQRLGANLIGRARGNASGCHSLEEEFMLSLNYGR